MTAEPTLPGGRELAAWWRALAAWKPGRLWYASVVVHHVEALAIVSRPVPLDPIQRALLLGLSPNAPANCLDNLGLDPQLLAGYLREFALVGLAHLPASGRPALTAVGQRALDRGEGFVLERQRRWFHFLDNACVGRPPEFVVLDPTMPGHPDKAIFDPVCLRHAVAAPPEWKIRRHFPLEVREILGLSPPPTAPDWRQTIVVHPERYHVALVETSVSDPLNPWCGFLVEPGNWRLRADRALFALHGSAQEIFPDFEADPATGQPEDEFPDGAPDRAGWVVAGSGRIRRAARPHVERPAPAP